MSTTIFPSDDIRRGWAEAFKNAVKSQGKSEDLFEDVNNDFDNEEWTW